MDRPFSLRKVCVTERNKCPVRDKILKKNRVLCKKEQQRRTHKFGLGAKVLLL
jgi:hypothetical protein